MKSEEGPAKVDSNNSTVEDLLVDQTSNQTSPALHPTSGVRKSGPWPHNVVVKNENYRRGNKIVSRVSGRAQTFKFFARNLVDCWKMCLVH